MSDKVKLRVDLSGKEDKSNKVTTLSSSSTNQQYPTAKTVYDAISELETGTGDYINDYYFDTSTKELVIDFTSDGSGGHGDTLEVSEFYIDTIHDEIVIVTDDESGSNIDIVTNWEQTLSDEKVPSEKLVKNSLDLKADTTHTHSQYLTEHQSLTDYIQKGSTTGLVKNDGTIMTSGTGSGNYAAGNHTHSNYVNPTIADNLTTNDSTQTLSAKQGKVLKEYVDALVGNIEEDMLT